jgi:hypothetical protein
MRIVNCNVLFLFVLLFEVPAGFAGQVAWLLQNATFSDGGMANGSFVYDATTNTVSQASITVSGGNTLTFPALTFTYPNGNVSYTSTTPNAPINGTFLRLVGPMSATYGENREFRIETNAPLTDAGGVINFNLSSPSAAECYDCNPYRQWTSGSVVSGARITSFAATPPTVRAGQRVTLSWVTQGAASVMIDQTVGSEPPAGSATVTPSNTTTYTLTAMSGASTVTSTVTVTVLTAPLVAISAFPSALLQVAGSGGATTRYTLTNAGGTATTINLSQNVSFFTQSPTSFTLDPGGSQVVTVTGLAEPAGPFQGMSTPSGSGVAAGLQVPIKLLSAAPPSGPVTADPSTNRVDVVTSSGTVDFTNSKDGTVTGILVSDAPWLIPPPGVITIPPHSTVTITFTIDRSQRPDSAALIGSATGNLSLVYLGNGLAKIGRNDTTTPSVSLVTVVDTVQLTVSAGSPPLLAAGEVALFIPGVGHAPGSVGLFISDVSVLNPLGRTINDLRFYYTSRGQTTASSKSASVPNVAANVSVALADVVKNVFGNDLDVGSLQLRSSLADKLGVNANVFVTSDPAGTFGTSIPIFRSDRAVGAGDRLFLTGLRSEPTLFHTNLYLQETSGVQTKVQAEYLTADGSSLATLPYTLDPFSMQQIGGMPAGSVSAIVTNTSTGSGKFLAYATPVDERSRDNWSVVDWSRQYGYTQSEPVVIPIAGKSQGLTGYFKTDATIMNTGTTQASGTLRYVANGVGIDRQVMLGGRQTAVYKDLTATLYGIPTATVGYLVFTPVTGTFAVTSRTYATATPDALPTLGSATPTVALAQALKAGSLRAMGGLEDAATIPGVVRPATFRTNFGLAEVTGNSVVVRVTLRFTYPAGAKVQGVGTASKDYPVSANGFVFVNGIASDILGAANRATLGDLHGMEADFQVISGNGAVTLFTSSVDNGSSDAINRVE